MYHIFIDRGIGKTKVEFSEVPLPQWAYILKMSEKYKRLHVNTRRNLALWGSWDTVMMLNIYQYKRYFYKSVYTILN